VMTCGGDRSRRRRRPRLRPAGPLARTAAAQALVASMPDAPFVVDHLAKPPIRAGVLQPWADLVSAWATCRMRPGSSAARHRGRLGGLEPGRSGPLCRPRPQPPGPDRLIFGSDWPVCTLAASYAQVVEVARIVTARSSDAERDAIFAGNAIRVYRLGSATPGRDG
jgi:L-fuconolactonase